MTLAPKKLAIIENFTMIDSNGEPIISIDKDKDEYLVFITKERDEERHIAKMKVPMTGISLSRDELMEFYNLLTDILQF